MKSKIRNYQKLGAEQDFRKECYHKYVIRKALEGNSLETFCKWMDEWHQEAKTQLSNIPFPKYLAGIMPGLEPEEKFLDEEFKSGEFMYELLSEDEFKIWAANQQPRDEEPSMPYVQARTVIELCIEHGILQDTQAVYVFSVRSSGAGACSLISKEDAIQDIMRNPVGQETLTQALAAKGVEIPTFALP